MILKNFTMIFKDFSCLLFFSWKKHFISSCFSGRSTQIILICIFYFSPYSRRILLMCLLNLQSNENKVFDFFLLPFCLKILSSLSQFGNSLIFCKYAERKNLLKVSRMNWSNLPFEYLFLYFEYVFARFVKIFTFIGKLLF